MKHCSLSFDELKIDRPRVARQMGYADGQLPTELAMLVDDILEEAVPLCDIRFAFAVERGFVFDRDSRMLTLAEGASFSLNKVIFHLLCESEELMFFICTAGSAITKWAESLAAAGDPLASFVVDALGSVMAEATADLMHRRIRGRMAIDNKEVTNRYSPGYCGWPVSDQPHLFSLFPEDICGVKLTEGCLMNPIKSVSGVIGVGEQVVFTPHLCSTCIPEHCPHN